MNQARRAIARDFARDWAILLSVIFVYFLLRAAAPGDEGLAVRVTLKLIRIEKWLHVFWEPEVQDFTLRWDWLKEVANYIYSYFHFPALAVMGVLLWFRDRAQFRLVRNTMFVSMVIGLAFYYLLPAAPPRLMALHGHDYGFRDTVFGGGTTVEYPTAPWFLNDYAAIPSFHFIHRPRLVGALDGRLEHRGALAGADTHGADDLGVRRDGQPLLHRHGARRPGDRGGVGHREVRPAGRRARVEGKPPGRMIR